LIIVANLLWKLTQWILSSNEGLKREKTQRKTRKRTAKLCFKNPTMKTEANDQSVTNARQKLKGKVFITQT
jgi:hypothetical protein